MQQTDSVVHTHVRSEIGCPERGYRSWSYAEIRDTRWYQVETCSHAAGPGEITTFITPDFAEALQLLANLRRNTWCAIRLYSRQPIVAKQGFVFETISRVFTNQEGFYVFQLDSGLMFSEQKGSDVIQVKLESMRQIYPCHTDCQ